MNRIRQLRHVANVKQADLANLLGTFQGTVSYWERGILEPDSYYLNEMAKFFNVTTDYLLGKNTMPDPPYDRETLGLLEQIQKRDEVKTLIDISKGATKEEIESVIKVLERLMRLRRE